MSSDSTNCGQEDTRWPRIRDLPEHEREPFLVWLEGQTRPLIGDLPMEEQDGYYRWDYDRWKQGRPVID